MGSVQITLTDHMNKVLGTVPISLDLFMNKKYTKKKSNKKNWQFKKNFLLIFYQNSIN
jgi:hypothetical protein